MEREILIKSKHFSIRDRSYYLISEVTLGVKHFRVVTSIGTKQYFSGCYNNRMDAETLYDELVRKENIIEERCN